MTEKFLFVPVAGMILVVGVAFAVYYGVVCAPGLLAGKYSFL
ncbi:MAG TPA: hypothetical protein PLV72_03180 [Candidatus Magasanikbacteria bacterium]|nr:hypothetical protein [Candidatus Magasanikbacteria bacterium]